MKTLLIIVLLSLSTIGLKAQVNKQDQETSIRLYNAGDRLIKAGTIFYAGFLTTTVGVAGLIAGGSTSNVSLFVVGTLMASAGSIITFTSWIQIIKAGKILKGTTAYISNDGLTLAYRF